MLTALALGITDVCGVRMEAAAMAEVVGRAESLSGAVGGAGDRGQVIDALTCLLAEAGTMLRFSAQPHRLVGPVPIPADLRVLALDTGGAGAGGGGG